MNNQQSSNHPAKKLLVRIERCTLEGWWYESHIGKEYTVVEWSENAWVVDGNDGMVIRKSDCTIISETETEKMCRLMKEQADKLVAEGPEACRKFLERAGIIESSSEQQGEGRVTKGFYCHDAKEGDDGCDRQCRGCYEMTRGMLTPTPSEPSDSKSKSLFKRCGDNCDDEYVDAGKCGCYNEMHSEPAEVGNKVTFSEFIDNVFGQPAKPVQGEDFIPLHIDPITNKMRQHQSPDKWEPLPEPPQQQANEVPEEEMELQKEVARTWREEIDAATETSINSGIKMVYKDVAVFICELLQAELASKERREKEMKAEIERLTLAFESIIETKDSEIDTMDKAYEQQKARIEELEADKTFWKESYEVMAKAYKKKINNLGDLLS